MEEFFIKNNGHTVQVESRRDAGMPLIKEGGLQHPYVFKQLHFHWGKENSRGSEHSTDNKRYPMEMHIVHENAEELSEGKAGLAVLAVFFKLSPVDNPYLEPIVAAVPQVMMPGSEAELPGSLILGKLLPADTQNYFQYNGSLTTPPCTEGVIWTVFAEPAYISIRQLRYFRLLKNSSGGFISDNYRPLQRVGGRKVLQSVPKPEIGGRNGNENLFPFQEKSVKFKKNDSHFG